MQTRRLTKSEFKATCTPKMHNVTETATDVLDIWPYVDSVAAADLEGHSINDGLVEYVYRSAENRFDHVLVVTRTKNVYLVVVVDLACDSIYGHMLLDLNREYGLAAPSHNNVYGVITAPEGLEPVLRAVEQVVGKGHASIYRSQFNGTATLRLTSETAAFETDRLDEGVQHFFNGSVGGSLQDIADFVRDLSDSLTRSGIEHSFEIYDQQQLVQRIPS